MERNREPLAERMRPETLDEVIGQTHLLGNAEILRRIVKQKEPVSLILWGPPGTGKIHARQRDAAGTERQPDPCAGGAPVSPPRFPERCQSAVPLRANQAVALKDSIAESFFMPTKVVRALAVSSAG